MIDRTHPVGERGDRRVVGDIHDVGGDTWVVVGGGELVLVAARYHDPRTL